MCKSIKFCVFLSLAANSASIVFVTIFGVLGSIIASLFGFVTVMNSVYEGNIYYIFIMAFGAVTFISLIVWLFSKLALYLFRKALEIAENK